MAIRDIFKISRKTFINPTAWIDYNSLKFQNQTLWSILKPLFTPARPQREETFEAAISRLGLTEEAVEYGAANYRIFAFGFCIIGFLTLFYSFFLLFKYSAFLGWLLGLGVSALFFAQAFKYDFWSLQMRRRKLGLTFAEWKESILGKQGPSA